MAVYLEKTGTAPPREEDDVMAAGSLLEDGIAKLYARREGVRVVGRQPTYEHPKHAWALATPDRMVKRGRKNRRIVEIKNASRPRDWGADGSDDIPKHYYTQVQWQLEVCQVEEADVAALFFGRDLRVFHLKRDPELGEMLLGAAENFWTGNVLPRVAPPLDGSDAADEYLRVTFPRSLSDALEPASAQSIGWAEQYLAADAEIKAATARKREAQQLLEFTIGSSEGIRGPGFKATWKVTASNGTDWEALARSLGATPTQIALHNRPGYRKFRLARQENEE